MHTLVALDIPIHTYISFVVLSPTIHRIQSPCIFHTTISAIVRLLQKQKSKLASAGLSEIVT